MMMLRNSERGSFKTCRHRWQWVYRDGRQSLDAPRALRFGDLVHQALAAYYPPGRKRGPHPAKTYERLYHEQAARLGDEGFNVYSDEKWIDALPLGVGMLEGYVRAFAGEDREWEVISTEQTFQLVIKTDRRDPVTGRMFRFKVVGTFDGVWRHRKSGRIVFKEFKTATAFNFDGLAMDDQAGMYWTYGPRWLRSQGILKPDELPSEIMYTFLRKAIPNPDKATDDKGRYLNKDGSVSKVQPAPFFSPRIPVYRDINDRRRIHERIVEEALDIARARADLIALYKNPGPLHMPNCRGCTVREACEVHETGGDFLPVLNATTVPWNPYAAHELAERH